MTVTHYRWPMRVTDRSACGVLPVVSTPDLSLTTCRACLAAAASSREDRS